MEETTTYKIKQFKVSIELTNKRFWEIVFTTTHKLVDYLLALKIN